MTKTISGKSGKNIPSKEKKTKNGGVKKINDSSSKNKATSSNLLSSSSFVNKSGLGANKVCSFHAEITGMMYAFGDYRKPLNESVSLVEDIVHQQMCSILVEANEIMNMRGGRFTSIDDILFLMRGNKHKLGRVIRYLRLKDQKCKTVKSTSPEEEEIIDTLVPDGNKGDSGKRLKLAYDFISSIDGTGELLTLFEQDDIVDEIKIARLKRAERMSRCLDSAAYMEYSDARQMSFSRKIGKFKDWLGIGTTFDMKTSSAVIEILSYLAYETVNEIVDLSLIIKEDQDRIDTSTTNIPVSTNPLSAMAKTTSSKQPVIPRGALPTPTHSPPNTPVSTVTPTNQQNTSIVPPTQGGLASSLGTASLASSLSGLVKPTKSKKKKTKHATNTTAQVINTRIQPSHVREAIRRYNSPKNSIHTLSGFSRQSLSSRILCL